MTAFISISPLRTAALHTWSNSWRVSNALSRRYSQMERPTRKLSTAMIRGFPNGKEADNEPSGKPGSSWDHLVDFPCVFTFKVIGVAQGAFANDIIDSVATALEMDRKFLKTSFRDKGKYRSITVDAPVNSSEQIYNVYAAIGRDPRVKFKF